HEDREGDRNALDREQARAGYADAKRAALRVERREAPQHAERDRECLAVSQPRLGPEDGHRGPGENRVAEHRAREVRRHILVVPHELGPGEGEEQHHCRPGAQLLWISQESLEWDTKGTRERPEVADE